jgi:hypothetical protein
MEISLAKSIYEPELKIETQFGNNVKIEIPTWSYFQSLPT